MFITNLEIEHFRGIQKGNIIFPLDSRVICMIAVSYTHLRAHET